MTDLPFDAEDSQDNEDGLHIDLPAFEGPLDLLLHLAREKRIDLSVISVLAIADQFLDWFHKATDLRLELAADWLVMAATLTLIKSRLLIPVPKEERAAAQAAMEDIATRLRRLEAIRSVSDEFLSRRRLGIHWHAPLQDADKGPSKRLDADLHALLLAYAREARRSLLPQDAPVRRPFIVVSVEDAIKHLDSPGVLDDRWRTLLDVLPNMHVHDAVHSRSRIAASYVAALELTKRGIADMHQEDAATVEVRRRVEEDA